MPVWVAGGRSNVVGAIAPRESGVILDMSYLCLIGEVNMEDLTVQVEAGVLGGELEELLNRNGLTLGHYPQSLSISTIGGWIATRATGTSSTLYGGIERSLAALDIVLADGTAISVQAQPRPSIGPALSEVFLGSEGAFGVIVRATLRVHRLPETRILRAFEIPVLETGLSIIRELLQRGVRPAVVRLYDEVESAAFSAANGFAVSGHLIVMAFDGPARVARASLKTAAEAFVAGGARDLGPAPARRWDQTRLHYRWLLEGNGIPHGTTSPEPNRTGLMADAIEVSASWSRLLSVVIASRAALRSTADEVWYHFSHFYTDGASVYFIFFLRRPDADSALQAYDESWRRTMEAVLEAGGNIAHHHGVGQVRLPWVGAQLGDGTELLRRFKHALDPSGILAPGNLGLTASVLEPFSGTR
jgi:alkyldihydroxyacetonephosphate synthase